MPERPIDLILDEYIQAAVPAVALRTSEESRALATILGVAKLRKCAVHAWNAREGLLCLQQADNDLPFPDGEETRFPANAAAAVLATIKGNSEADQGKMPGILVFLDLQTWLRELDPPSERVLRDLVATASESGLFVIFLGSTFAPPASFARHVTVLDYRLPDREGLDKILGKIERSCAEAETEIKLTPINNGQREALLRAATGLTCHEAETAYALAVARAYNPEKPRAARTLDAQVVSAEKALAIKRTGTLDIIEPDPRGLDAVGGLSRLKSWLLQRREVYSPKARAYKLPSPKGVLLAGIPGTGKSLTADILGAVFGVPALRLDMGRLFGSLVGESEGRTDEVLAMVDAVAPCCLILGEIEKSLQGTHGGASHDSGVGARILGKLLEWSQNHTSDVFMAATCNEPWLLPAPLLRRGRFDALFFIDVPGPGERAEIAGIHISRFGRDPRKFDLPKIAQASREFVGSEIEEAVKSALFAAFHDDGREVTTKDILAACVEIAKSKMVDVMAEQIERMRKFGERCQKASDEKELPSAKAEQPRKIMSS